MYSDSDSDSDFVQDAFKIQTKNYLQKFFGVYLLLNLSPKRKNHTYIGFTVDPFRRLKQHNAGCDKGGAKSTTDKGPWDMILVIHGFPNAPTARKFEWAWQNPHISRRLKEIVPKKKRGENGLDFRLKVLSYMLRVGPWCRLGITVRWWNQKYTSMFPADRPPPNHMPIAYGPIELNKKKATKKKITAVSNLTSTQSKIDPICNICQDFILPKDVVECLNDRCNISWHLICIAEQFLRQNYPNKYLIPIEGQCEECKSTLIWTQLIEHHIHHSAK